MREPPQVGPKTALNLVQKHGSMEKVLQSLDREKYPIPEPFPYEEARRLFKGTHRFALGTPGQSCPGLPQKSDTCLAGRARRRSLQRSSIGHPTVCMTDP